LLQLGCQVIDLSADFRVRSAAVYKEFYAHEHPAPDLLAQAVYGLPEVYRARIKTAALVASPGCYPTSILLRSSRCSGRPGASERHHRRFAQRRQRRRAQGELDYLFVECNESVRPYGLPKHRHLSEIEQNSRWPPAAP